MTTRKEWQAVHAEMLAEQRRKLGAPPTAEEVLAYQRGALPEAEAERIRDLLACYPELARTLAVPFPDNAVDPADMLSDEEWTRHWAALQKRMQSAAPSGGRLLQFWRASAALAAGLALVFGGLWWRADSKLAEPRVPSEEVVLWPEGRRGPEMVPVTFSPDAESILLTVSLLGHQHYSDYRLAILDVSDSRPRQIWSSKGLHRSDADTFSVLVPRRFLKPSRYHVVIYGLDRDGEDKLATYLLRVPDRERRR